MKRTLVLGTIVLSGAMAAAVVTAEQAAPAQGRGGGGFPGGMPVTLGGGGGLIAIVVVLAFLFLGGGGGLGDLGSLTGQTVGPSGQPSGELAQTCQTGQDANERDDCRIVAVINSVQAYWSKTLRGYEGTRTRFFDGSIQTGCGPASSATGPFYCPRDHRVYIDLGFYDELKRRFGAPGDFAQAYVLTHEIGHHVQSLLGTEERVRQAQQQNPRSANELSVRMELQADCYAGIWGHSTSQRNILEQGDVEAGLNAAAAIGDDRIQRMSGSRVAPERFTHGSSAQRVEWFKRGLQSGRLDSCDTFGR